MIVHGGGGCLILQRHVHYQGRSGRFNRSHLWRYKHYTYISHYIEFVEINAAKCTVKTKPGLVNGLAGKQTALGMGIWSSLGVLELDRSNSKPLVTELLNASSDGLLLNVITTPGLQGSLLMTNPTLGRIHRVSKGPCKLSTSSLKSLVPLPSWTAVLFDIGVFHLRSRYLDFV